MLWAESPILVTMGVNTTVTYGTGGQGDLRQVTFTVKVMK
jgi:hypothetical protein